LAACLAVPADNTTARQILTVLGIDLDQVPPETRSLHELLDTYIADLTNSATPTH
jgi:hypothetical protein